MKARFLIAAALGLALGVPAAEAAEAPVAKVNGVAIPQSAVDAIAKAQASQGQPDTPELRAHIRDRLIMQEVVAQEAVKRGLDKTPLGAAELQFARQSTLAQLYVQDYARRNPITEDALKKEYDRAKTQTSDKEFHVHHILVKNEDEAKDIIAQLKKGASFEKLAEEKSIDSSKSNGGDLGWAVPQMYVPAFANAIKGLKKGQITDTPVQTQFGWHVIRLDDQRAHKIPSFDEVKPQIRNQLQQQAINKALNDLRAKAKVE
jgi:peptidyl-prolyl cis-trans isomerase C